jgi:hypothetical protein
MRLKKRKCRDCKWSEPIDRKPYFREWIWECAYKRSPRRDMPEIDLRWRACEAFKEEIDIYEP